MMGICRLYVFVTLSHTDTVQHVQTVYLEVNVD